MYNLTTQSAAAAPPPAAPCPPAAAPIQCAAPRAEACYVRVLTKMFANLVWLR